MHEFSICQGLLSQLDAIAKNRAATAVDRVRIKAGPLSGVEPPLLQQAFRVARTGTLAERAELEIEMSAVLVHCDGCDCDTEVPPNRLLCGNCGGWQVHVSEGTELLLVSVELSGIGKPVPQVRQTGRKPEDARHV